MLYITVLLSTPVARHMAIALFRDTLRFVLAALTL